MPESATQTASLAESANESFSTRLKPFRLTRFSEEDRCAIPKVVMPLEAIKHRVARGDIAIHRGLAAYEDLYFASRDLEPATQQAYKTTLGGLIGFLGDTCAIREPAQIRTEHLAAYRSELTRQNLSRQARRRHERQLRSFLGFLSDIGALVERPTQSPSPLPGSGPDRPR